MKRDVPGFAVGGLSGGEAKEQFWRFVPFQLIIMKFFLSEVIFLLKNGGSFCSIPSTNCTSLSDGSWTSGVLVLYLFFLK